MKINGINANVHKMSQDLLKRQKIKLPGTKKHKIPYLTKSLANKNNKNNEKPLHDLAAARLVKKQNMWTGINS